MKELSNYHILGKLKCSFIHLHYDTYDDVVMKIIHQYERTHKQPSFVDYVERNYKSFKSETRRSLIRAFTRFQEEAISTNGLEHRLQQ
jgi:hypothetical protein